MGNTRAMQAYATVYSGTRTTEHSTVRPVCYDTPVPWYAQEYKYYGTVPVELHFNVYSYTYLFV